mmetsp:Transcript_58689/g.163781  ORF Transcript_58689/g.163781 Transcript_58689/m.163781 type:complete len:237 (+) Transcript_58689:575-1285(+)
MPSSAAWSTAGSFSATSTSQCGRACSKKAGMDPPPSPMQRMRMVSWRVPLATGSTGAPSTFSAASTTATNDWVYSSLNTSPRSRTRGATLPGGAMHTCVIDWTRLVLPLSGSKLSKRHCWMEPGGAPGGGSSDDATALTLKRPPPSRGRLNFNSPGNQHSSTSGAAAAATVATRRCPGRVMDARLAATGGRRHVRHARTKLAGSARVTTVRLPKAVTISWCRTTPRRQSAPVATHM